MTKILNQAEASAIYDAMCALNNIGASIETEIRNGDVWVKEYSHDGSVTIMSRRQPTVERYSDQNEFVLAYNLTR